MSKIRIHQQENINHLFHNSDLIASIEHIIFFLPAALEQGINLIHQTMEFFLNYSALNYLSRASN